MINEQADLTHRDAENIDEELNAEVFKWGMNKWVWDFWGKGSNLVGKDENETGGNGTRALMSEEARDAHNKIRSQDASEGGEIFWKG